MKKLIINFLALVIIGCSGVVFGQELDAVSDMWLNSETVVDYRAIEGPNTQPEVISLMITNFKIY
ncbi:MAG: hypothetical protein K8R74_02020 [Bacteroidales bacterium]|nr:hypothetical protein [Bacteroidales bacterium]